jgi:hypothetical protein
MRVGIPAYRLPREVLDAEIEEIKKAGIELKTATRIESVDGLFGQGYDAVFVAVGAHRGVRLGIEGEESPGVIDALSLLRRVWAFPAQAGVVVISGTSRGFSRPLSGWRESIDCLSPYQRGESLSCEIERPTVVKISFLPSSRSITNVHMNVSYLPA